VVVAVHQPHRAPRRQPGQHDRRHGRGLQPPGALVEDDHRNGDRDERPEERDEQRTGAGQDEHAADRAQVRAGRRPRTEPHGHAHQRRLGAERRPGDQAGGAHEQDRRHGLERRRRRGLAAGTLGGAERVQVGRRPARLAQRSHQRRQHDAERERQRDDPPAHVVAVDHVVPQPVGAVLDHPLEPQEHEPVDHAERERERERAQQDHGARAAPAQCSSALNAISAPPMTLTATAWSSENQRPPPASRPAMNP
jgi:hypothetical protein